MIADVSLLLLHLALAFLMIALAWCILTVCDYHITRRILKRYNLPEQEPLWKIEERWKITTKKERRPKK